jgi:hypothetical protein
MTRRQKEGAGGRRSPGVDRGMGTMLRVAGHERGVS